MAVPTNKELHKNAILEALIGFTRKNALFLFIIFR